jgi:FMN phosphatase YigB (HAD superfamily)
VFGCDPRTLLLIDDSRLNVDGAARAGWGGLRFENAEQCADALVSLGYL